MCSSSAWLRLRVEEFSSTMVQSPSTTELVSVRSVAEPTLYSSTGQARERRQRKERWKPWWGATLPAGLPLLVSRDRKASCVCGEYRLECADDAVSMSLAPSPIPSSHVWLVGVARVGAVSMSLFIRLSADCDFKSRVLRTLMDTIMWVRDTYKKTDAHRTVFSTHLSDSAHSSEGSWGCPQGWRGKARENPHGASSTPTQNHPRGPRGSARGTTSLWVQSRAEQRSTPGRGAAPAPGGDERGARASYQYTCFLHTPPHDCWDRIQERRRHSDVTATEGKTKALQVCVGVSPNPLAEGPEGMLKVFWRLNLPVLMESADWDKLMLRFLKNSKPPVELGS